MSKLCGDLSELSAYTCHSQAAESVSQLVHALLGTVVAMNAYIKEMAR
jgi:hypothetical protein